MTKTLVRRRLQAVVLVAVLVLMVPTAECCRQMLEGQSASGLSVNEANIDLSAVLAGHIDAGQSYTEAEKTAFEQELCSLDGRDEVRFSAEAKTAGFTSNLSASEQFQQIAQELQAKGWTCYSQEAAAQGTFVKELGSYTWAYVFCGEVSGSCVVVIQAMEGNQV